MKLLLRLIRDSWPTLLFASALGAVSGAANVGLLAIVHRSLRMSDASSHNLLWMFVAVCFASLVTRIASQMFLVRVSQDSISRLRLGLCQRILETPLRQLEEIGMHRMIVVLTNDVSIVGMAMNSLPSVFVSVVILLCGAVYLGFLSWQLLVAALLFGIAGGLSYWGASRVARRYNSEGREAQDGLLNHIRNLINGIKELKMHAGRRQEFVEQALDRADEQVRENQYKGMVIQDAAIVWGRLLFLVAIGLLIFVWPMFAQPDAETMAGYTLAIFFLMSPLERIFAFLPLLSRAGISIYKINKLGLMLDEQAVESVVSAAPVTSWNSIELSQVTHGYHREGQEGGFLLGPIDWKLQPGEIVFVVGGNGSGKTTLIKLLTGLYAPLGGQILLDDRPVNGDSREVYRQLFAAVFDDAMVFEGLWGVSREDRDARAHQYLAELRLEHLVKISDGKFSTTELSRGQRKRLALLTAYLEDRSIYVFDEWAADQDPTFKKVFYEQLLPELKRRGKTVVAITHDDRYFAAADRLIRMEDGRFTGSSSFHHQSDDV